MAALLLKNAHVYAPEDLGVRDVLLVNDRIVAVDKDIVAVLPDLEVIDLTGKILTPGFFDQHIHVTGGGGEAGPVSRPPELMLSEVDQGGDHLCGRCVRHGLCVSFCGKFACQDSWLKGRRGFRLDVHL